MEAVIGVWLLVGIFILLGLLVSGNLDDEMKGLFALIFIIASGPISIIVLLVMWLKEKKPDGDQPANTINKSAIPPEEEANSLIEELSVSFLEDGSPAKSDYVKLKRLCKLLVALDIQELGIKEAVCVLLQTGLDQLDSVYSDSENTGAKRKAAISEALKLIAPELAQEAKGEVHASPASKGGPEVSSVSTSFETAIDRILRPLYLFAAADGFVSKSQIEAMVEFRATARGLFEAREAIEYFIKTDDFEGAKKLFDGESFFLQHDINDTVYVDLPEYLKDLHEQRVDIQTVEETLELYENEAAKISDDFEREVVLLGVAFVGSRRGESKNEVEEKAFLQYTTENCWSLDPDRPDFITAAYSVLEGEELSREPLDLADLLEETGLDLDDLEGLEESEESEETDESHHKVDTSSGQNALAQVFSLITMVLSADGEDMKDQEKMGLIGEITPHFWDFYEYDDPEDYGDDALGAIESTLQEIVFQEGHTPDNIVEKAAVLSASIEDATLAEAVCSTLDHYELYFPLGKNGQEILSGFKTRYGLNQ